MWTHWKSQICVLCNSRHLCNWIISINYRLTSRWFSSCVLNKLGTFANPWAIIDCILILRFSWSCQLSIIYSIAVHIYMYTDYLFQEVSIDVTDPIAVTVRLNTIILSRVDISIIWMVLSLFPYLRYKATDHKSPMKVFFHRF